MHRLVPLLAILCAASLGHAAERLNVLFIAADDLRTDLASYGHPAVQTPHLDRLAQRSLVFTRAYCPQAVCNPSRSALLTGRRPDALRVWSNGRHFRTTAPDAITLPQHFQRSGYFTQGVGKIFHNWHHDVHGDPASWSTPAVMHFANHNADDAKVEGPLPPSSAVDPKCECRDVPDDAYFDGRVARLAVEALEQRQAAGQPFFLAVGFWKPHAPFNAPKKYWDLYRREEIAMPAHPDWPAETPRLAWHDGRELLGFGKTARTPSPDSIREMRHGYLANISYLDAQIGRVLDALDRLQLAERTVIVFWSDHGYHLGEKTLFAKTSNFESDARVAFLIATPGMKSAGQKTAALAELLDLYPTLSSLCGLPTPAPVDGLSLVPVLENPQATVRQAALTQHPRPAYYDREPSKTPTHMGYTIRSATHRYTEWRDWQTGAATARELYDHTTDPDEVRNLAGQADQDAVLARHSRLLQQLKPLVAPGWTPVEP